MRQRLVRILATHYWETMPAADFDQIVDSLIINLQDTHIHSEEDLGEFLGKEVSIKEVSNLP